MFEWSDDFKATKDGDDRFAASWSFTTRLSVFHQVRPRLGDPCERTGFTDLIVRSMSLRHVGGGLVECQVKFDDGEDDDDDDEGGDDDEEKYSLKISTIHGTNFEPILSSHHLRNKDGSPKLSQQEANIFSWWVAGKLVLCADGKLRPKKFSKDFQLSYDVPEVPGLAAALMAGFRRIPVPTLRVRKTYKARRPDAGKIGEIAKVKDNIDNYDYRDSEGYTVNWMPVSYTVKKIARNQHEITEEYALSYKGGYDKTLYT